MTIETDFRAMLIADGAVSAIVGTRVAQNAIPQGFALPYIVYVAEHDPQRGLNGVEHVDQCQIECQCWAKPAAAADALADAVEAAVETYDNAQATKAVYVVARRSGYDTDLALDTTVLVITWVQ
jgi:hypothetical protein